MPAESLQELAQEAFDAGIALLKKNHELYPYAMVQNAAGKITYVAKQMESEHPKTEDVIRGLLDLFRNVYSEADAVALGRDVRIRESDGQAQDALTVLVERRSGESWEYYLVYQRNGDEYEFGKLTVSHPGPVVFATDDSIRARFFQL
ncbi:MAG: hypothetical protein HY917_05490 [Candidatus Diapherotrites archaeon]|nr:hypothetical protein [Candidatus Diapherotrites archaeon]